MYKKDTIKCLESSLNGKPSLRGFHYFKYAFNMFIIIIFHFISFVMLVFYFTLPIKKLFWAKSILSCHWILNELLKDFIHRISHIISSVFFLQSQGVQRPGKPGNVREFRCKEKQLEASQGIFEKQGKSGKNEGILLCEIHFQPT